MKYKPNYNKTERKFKSKAEKREFDKTEVTKYFWIRFDKEPNPIYLPNKRKINTSKRK